MDQAKLTWVLLSCGAWLGTGCGGDPGQAFTDAGTQGDAAIVTDAAPAEDAAVPDITCETTPTYAELQVSIFGPRCATGRCHGGTDGDGPARGPSNFTSISTRDAMVDRPSVHMMGLVLVRPGDPEGSFLMAKLTNDLPADHRLQGVAMPPGIDMPWVSIPESELEEIRCWIAGGAP
jgi:hypothetical protein